jgi:hypothetical protein
VLNGRSYRRILLQFLLLCPCALPTAVLADSSLPPLPDSLEDQPVSRANDSNWQDVLETDRDSFTPATTLAGKQRLITEASYSFLDNRGIPETHSFPELLFRYGLHEQIEFRLGWNYEIGGASNTIASTDLGDVIERDAVESRSSLYTGLKLAATKEDRWKPESAFIVEGYYPTSGEIKDSQIYMTYVFGWTIFNDWKWDTAVHYGTGTQADNHNFRVFAPSSVLRIPVADRWRLHAEYFGVSSQGKNDDFTLHYFSPGLHYLFTPNFESGVRLGWGLNEEAANFFLNAGIGWRR